MAEDSPGLRSVFILFYFCYLNGGEKNSQVIFLFHLCISSPSLPVFVHVIHMLFACLLACFTLLSLRSLARLPYMQMPPATCSLFGSVLLGVDKSQARRGRDLRKSVLRLRLRPASLHKREN